MSDKTNASSNDGTVKETPQTFGLAARAGLASARENALPGIVLWIVAAAIVGGFYFYPPITKALERLGVLKSNGGFLYSAISTGIFGGVIPSLYRSIRNRNRDESLWKTGVFLTLFWAWKGVELDLVYRGQALLFGSGASASVLIPKVLVDQFIYNPLWASWTQILAYWFIEHHFRPSSLLDKGLWGTMGWRIITVLISTWGVWIPLVTIIYAMPGNLQIPLFNFALCFWSLMLSSLTKEKK
jgi:hypothetical protein